MKKKKRIILASTSPRRKDLLEQIGLNFEIVPSMYEEDMDLRMNHAKLSEYLAYGKAQNVAENVEDGVVIGSDTFVVFGGQRLGKPKNKKQAGDMLYAISGQWVTVYSGLAIVDVESRKKYITHEVTKIKIKVLVDEEIRAYIKTGEPLDKAGAFAIQEKGAMFIEKISGCYTGVIGLPLHCLYKGLQEIGVDIWNFDK